MRSSSSSALKTLEQDFGGEIIMPGAGAYDEARTIFNAMIDRRPAVIAQCADVQDVVSALRFGREQELEIAIRGGGHGVAGKALTEGGLVIDLRRMNAVTVDPDGRTARVEGGATMSHLDRATQPHDLATTGGRVSTTGVGGYTLGGGNGWLDRKFGLACDNLLSVELVTADGQTLTASDSENPDLFWALHGGGGNFGVATALTFRLYPLKSVTAALMIWRPEKAPDILPVYRDFMLEASDDLGGGALYLTGPEEDFVPEDLRGRLAFAILVVYAGGEAEARRLAAPILGLAPDGVMIAEMPYADFQCMLDDPPGFRNYWSAEYIKQLPDAAIERFCSRAADMIVPSASQHVLFPGGGAVLRESADWPIPWRSAPWIVHPFGLWLDAADDGRGRQWAHAVKDDMKPWSIGAVYLNFIGDEGEDRVRAGFGADNYARLSRIKAHYDPDNLFHLNHNILPA